MWRRIPLAGIPIGAPLLRMAAALRYLWRPAVWAGAAAGAAAVYALVRIGVWVGQQQRRWASTTRHWHRPPAAAECAAAGAGGGRCSGPVA